MSSNPVTTPSTLPAFPPNMPNPAKETPMLTKAIELLTEPWDPFNRAQHEATMNAWLIRYTIQENQRKLDTFMHAWSDYKINYQRAIDLGIAPPPWNMPAPALTDVGPMPDGYWFQI